MKQSFWIYNPLILIDKRYIKDIFPLDSMKESEKLNALTRLTIMLSIISYIITNSIYTIVSCVISIVAIIKKKKKMDCVIFGISKDNLKSHLKFKKKYKIKFELLSDENKSVIKSFKTWGKKKFMGKEFMGQIRSTFLIKNNKIINEWRNVRVKNHALEVLNFIKDDK